MSDFRCAAEARARGDELAGTASTVRGFLLLEHAGPWGVDALRDARLLRRLRRGRGSGGLLGRRRFGSDSLYRRRLGLDRRRRLIIRFDG